MNKNYGKISIFGSKADIEEIEKLGMPSKISGNEKDDRLLIQDLIDKYKIKATILYNGNTVWGYDKTIRQFKALQKNGMDSMTNYLYDFFSLELGTIAHYNKAGWITTYPTIDALKQLFKKNEYGDNVVSFQPVWATDRIKIVKEMWRLLFKEDFQ